MYEKPPQSYSELFEPFSEEIKELGKVIRSKIIFALPEADENVYGGKKVGNSLYSIGGENNVVCGIQPQMNFVRVFFHNWERLKDAGYSVVGSGKNARHVKIKKKSDLDDFDLKAMVEIVR